jgi:general secretion pathway protein H
VAGELVVVRFHPDETSSGTVLKLSREEAQHEVRVNWYTGGVAIVP